MCRLGNNLLESFSYVILKKGKNFGAFELLEQPMLPEHVRYNERYACMWVYV
jgi:hypothetical protein